MKATPLQMRLTGLLALAVGAAILASLSLRTLTNAEASPPFPVEVARARLETRAGKLFRHGAAIPFTGCVIDFHPDGAVKLRSYVKEGRLDGESDGWFANGSPEVREYFQRGLPHGTRTTWHENGRMRSEGQLVAGQQHGLYRQWHENGELAAEAEFFDGKPHGLSRAWYPSGCLKAEALMNHGEVQTRQVYPDGAQREPTLFAANQVP